MTTPSRRLAACCGALALTAGLGTAAPAHAQSVDPARPVVSLPVLPLPSRTAMDLLVAPGIELSTPNAHEQQPAESIAKLYVADAVLHDSPTPADLADLRAMITASDDEAADRVQERYPHAIAETIARYGLRETTDSGYWGTLSTSVHDVVTLVTAIHTQEPGSPILDWMAHFSPVAADGTVQDWGTVNLPAMIGTKFGWSGYGPDNVASASFGQNVAVAANTWGTPRDETADVTLGGSVTARGPLGSLG